MDNYSYLNAANAPYIEELYQRFKNEPETVEYGWQKFFEGFDFARNESASTVTTEAPKHFLKEINVLNMINGYRIRGHLFTKTNPVRERRKYFPGKELETFGLSESDLDTVFQSGIEVGLGPVSLREIRNLLEQTYCESIGTEYKYIRNPLKTEWFEKRMESTRNTPNFTLEEKKQILNKLNQAVVFENFLGTKFLGQKRFSLEGAESLIPALDAIIEQGAELGIEEFVIGMAHRGRLNVLANIMNKTYKQLFEEFEGKFNEDDLFGGDVKYHLGFSTDIITNKNKKVHLSLSPNPSHLEAVAPVVEGMVRAKIDSKYHGDLKKISPILIHGDASVAGQGIVYEVLQMSKLDGYKTGGTIHLVINNQIGFTTNFKDARSSTYCTDIGKVTLSPVFHVNGDDVEALLFAIKIAMEYRQTFMNDVFIDILCYRKYGHNEADEPRFTQPLLYKLIEQHKNPREIYVEKLLQSGSINAELAKEMEKNFRKLLQERLDETKTEPITAVSKIFEGSWKDMRFATGEDFRISPDTSVSEKEFVEIALKSVELPKDKKFFRKIEKLFEDRKNMLSGEGKLDWAMGELLAYGTLLTEGHPVRFSGQDVERGTFSHRHAVVTIEDSDEEYTPLSFLSKEQAPFYIFNSHLSEYGVLGFEYGYAMASPNALLIWEAQFGDFVNGAQIIIDQFLTSAETKWRRSNGLVMLLPHGYEGQGPEHSSARMERFLEACSGNNIQIVNCTTPANMFHVLRRQLKRQFRKPLIIFTPKSLLRHPLCVSKIKDFTTGGFKELIDDTFVTASKVKRVLFCTGKIYYELLEFQQKEKRADVAIVRIEQIYPFPKIQYEDIKEKYKKASDFYWIQEEPENMGAWPYLCRLLRSDSIQVISRRESSSTATGYSKQHIVQQTLLVTKAFEILKKEEKIKVAEEVKKDIKEAAKFD